MNAEFFSALEQLEKEKGISQKYMLEKIELALQSAFKREYGATALMRVDIDADKKKMRAFLQKEVVEEVEDPICQISLEDARAINRGYELGSMVEKEVKTDSMHRLAPQPPSPLSFRASARESGRRCRRLTRTRRKS